MFDLTHSLSRALLLVLGVVLFGTGARSCNDEYPALSPNVQRIPAVKYGVGNVATRVGNGYRQVPLLLDVLTPTDAPATGKPALVLVHGGGFEAGDRDSEELVAYADGLASRGIVCFIITYRLLGDDPPAPPEYSEPALRRAAHAAIVDVKAAIRFVRARAAEYGVDPARIGVLGDSAGAIASIGAGMTDATLFSNDGVNFPIPAENNPQVSSEVAVVGSFWGSGDAFLEYFDAGDPPLLIVHGTADEQPETPYEDAVRMAETCAARGIPYALYPLEGAGHRAWAATVDGKNLAEITLTFLGEHL